MGRNKMKGWSLSCEELVAEGFGEEGDLVKSRGPQSGTGLPFFNNSKKVRLQSNDKGVRGQITQA